GNGSNQQLGIDCDETFSPVVKLATIRTVLSSATRVVLPLVLDFTTAVVTLLCSFFVKDLRVINYFLGISATRHSTGLFLSQKEYAIELHARGLQYLTFPRPDISYAIQQICLYMHEPREPHLAALKRILCYIRGTLDFGFHLYSYITISLVGYTNTDWAGCLSTRRSTSGYSVFLGDNLLSWSFKCHHTISRSSAEAEYQGVANVIAETAWLRNLLRELHSPLSAATLVYCDKFSATYMSANPV
nr:ribonuclease H-like domain-containing protein [Tanacetum cinerariifolium]